MLKDNIKSHLHLHLIVFIWGFTAILGSLISLEAMPLVWYRMLLAVGFILIYVKLKKIPLQVSQKEVLKFTLSGLIIAFHWFTFFKAIKVSNISVTLACLSTGAFFTTLLEPLFGKKKIVFYELILGLIVVAGLILIFHVEKKYVEGIILGLLSASLSATFAIVNSKFVKKHSPVVISFYELLGGVLFFSVLLLITGGFNASFFKISVNDFYYLLILSSICTAYAFVVSTSVMKYLTPYTVMLTINLEPVYGIILAVILFEDKEKMSPEFYLGAFIILTTILINGILKNRTK
ncbi:DMT family transporter [Flavobacterium aciduliphilum]|uniref:EamA-like transporter family protein n=1 Tax=Flavobacterium aciduliphilum TaxID=1101402 RepID=A0A328Y9B9_9FLAO|nr:DMT family transporter [Flavobacterium aciduliphilum]RAR70190.1 EamA-like transporter family protein [Flavobacterium aciduliphilum]